MLKVEMKDIVEAYGRIRNYVQKTPLIYSPETSERRAARCGLRWRICSRSGRTSCGGL